MKSIRKVANGFAFTILLLFAAVTVALLVSCASSTQIEGANPTSSMLQTITMHVSDRLAVEPDDLASK